MTRDESMKVAAMIGNLITGSAPTVDISPQKVAAARAEFSDEDLREMREIGLFDGDFLKFYVIRELCARMALGDVADGLYILKLFENAAHLDAEQFLSDPYLHAVHFPECRRGNILLSHAEYAAGEIFQYDEPRFDCELVTPRLGFFDRPVSFPAVYEGLMPWMSVCPSEMLSMESDIAAAHGRVLVLGLGLGYYPFMIARRAEVSEITVVELNGTIIDLFQEHVFPAFEHKEKIRVVHADAIAYLEELRGGEFDFCFADIWEGAVDGAPLYKKILPHEKRLTGTEFAYWLKEPILSYLADTEGKSTS